MSETVIQHRPRVIVIGAGFGGVFAVRAFAKTNADVLLIDRQNFHTFTPLLYQVATSGLDPEEIAYPIRGIFYDRPNVSFLLGDVTAIDSSEKLVDIQTSDGVVRHEDYDYLIVAAGSVTHYFNQNALQEAAFELKTLNDAVLLRNHVLRLFEQAAWTQDEAERDALTTIVVVGGGPTGLETAGAIRELYTYVLKREHGYRNLKARVILVEATDKLLATYPIELQKAAREQLESLGVEVVLSNPVVEASAENVRLKDGREIGTHTLIWLAGVNASPLAQMLDVPLGKQGRIPVTPTLEVIGRENVYVVGDMAYLEDANGQPYPMLIPVAQQQGTLAAENILRRERGWTQKTFHYHDRGTMATIGRSRAVALIYNRIPLRGFIAWVAWLGLHLVTLMGFRNRLQVLLNWVWNYFTYERSVRIILEPEQGRAKRETWPSTLHTPERVGDKIVDVA
ncbi:MAG: NAD(P)/FAD-dependent oxidoreductase [Burkholderiales bacterium]|nr:NAD(P)/FAD-dependent oxidoreductase [Anaerolineae bacterium]